MKTLRHLCKPRAIVFDSTKQDVVLNLTDLIENRIDQKAFFGENYLTEGMKRLLREAFKRFAGQSSQGIFALRQAMGGGKTHNMIALGLLAKYPYLRTQVMGDLNHYPNLDRVNVVAFTGRESDARYGIWGAIADQLGKVEAFSEYYSPPKAPGESSWVRLLEGDPLLILLDELPSYLENARSQIVGNSDLAQVTINALSTLLSALNRAELHNVCLVISNLDGAYEEGSQDLDRLLNLKYEVDRGAVKLEPIRLNTDEFYHILRKRLFEQLPDECEVMEVVRGYVQALRDAKQMELIHLSPDQLVGQLKDAYPFHFAIRDLYARFRENPGFQQTRGLLRLMRAIVSRLFDEQTGKADQQFLIHAHDLDLNDLDTLEEVARINDKFSNAISHDIAAGGYAVAECIDAELGKSDAQDICKLLFVSSLANIPNPLLGLSRPEIIAFLCAPERDVTSLSSETIEALLSQAWYLYENPAEGKYYFRDIKNLVAMVNSLAEGYSRDVAVFELRKFLERIFIPSRKDCYQEVLAFPGDDITNVQDKVTLVIYEPHISGLHPDLKKVFNDLTYRNRILFLSGTQTNLEHAIHLAARLKAINSILSEMKAGSRPDLASLHVAAEQLHERVLFGLLSAVREIFTTLTYPYGDQLADADFPMKFSGSTYDGEQQVREALKQAQKFTEEISDDIFCKKCEARLFTRKEMLWSEIKRRAAENTHWPWHRMNALDLLKEEQIRKGHWREHGAYIEKPPFPPPETEVRVQQIYRDEETGKAKLKLTPMHGDTIYWTIGSEITTHAQVVPDSQNFETDEVALSFFCIDSSGQHQTGKTASWTNRVAIKYLVSSYEDIKRVELRAIPAASIYYTIDDSDPKTHGQLYKEPFPVSPPTTHILAVAQKDGVHSPLERIRIFWDAEKKVRIDDTMPATWKRPFTMQTTQEVYDFLLSLKKYQASVLYPRIIISGRHWLELTCDDELMLEAGKLEEAIEHMRNLLLEHGPTITLSVNTLQFPTGISLRSFAAGVKSDILPEEVIQ